MDDITSLYWFTYNVFSKIIDNSIDCVDLYNQTLAYFLTFLGVPNAFRHRSLYQCRLLYDSFVDAQSNCFKNIETVLNVHRGESSLPYKQPTRKKILREKFLLLFLVPINRTIPTFSAV